VLIQLEGLLHMTVLQSRVADASAKAATLIEALPWLNRFHGQTVVIKYGGYTRLL